MKNKSDTVVVLFNGGGYGTFLEWAIRYFSGDFPDDSRPFNSNGNSHQYVGTHLMNIDGWRDYLATQSYQDYVRFHPKAYEHDSIKSHLDEILSHGNRAILLYPTTNDIALTINNKFDKIYEKGWMETTDYIGLPELISKWGTEDLKSMEPWQLREFLSFYIVPQHLAEVGVNDIIEYEHERLFKLPIRTLINDFSGSFNRIAQFTGRQLLRSNFDEIYQDWMQVQYHTSKDALVDTIVKCVVNDVDIYWADANLTIVDQALIQMQLRDKHGISIKCFGLNEFPTSTTELKPLLEHE